MGELIRLLISLRIVIREQHLAWKAFMACCVLKISSTEGQALLFEILHEGPLTLRGFASLIFAIALVDHIVAEIKKIKDHLSAHFAGLLNGKSEIWPTGLSLAILAMVAIWIYGLNWIFG